MKKMVHPHVFWMLFLLWRHVVSDNCTTSYMNTGACAKVQECGDLDLFLRSFNDNIKKPGIRSYIKSNVCSAADVTFCCNVLEFESVLNDTLALNSPAAEETSFRVAENSIIPDFLLPTKAECGTIQVGDRIQGGVDSVSKEFPWMAQLLYEKKYSNTLQLKCAGVIISKQYVLTTAHCVQGQTVAKVRIGTIYIDPTTQNVTENITHEDFDVKEVVIHSFFQKGLNGVLLNDIALLRLNGTIKINETMRPICLPKKGETPDYKGKIFTAAGWGRTGYGPNATRVSNVLKKVGLPFVSSSDCARKLDTINVRIYRGAICAGGDVGRDTCNGDSGGPIMLAYGNNSTSNWYVVGLTSFGVDTCGLDYPGVYTDVRDHYNWILSHLMP